MSDQIPLTVSTLFGHREAHPAVLDLVLLHQFGMEWLFWEPETLWYEIETTFGEVNRRANWTVRVSEQNKNKIQAARTLHVSEGFWSDWEAFVPIILSLNNVAPDFETLNPPSIAQLMAGMDIASEIRSEPMAPLGDVPVFVGAVALEHGVCWLPPPVDFANDKINPKIYHCPECGNTDTLSDDGLCDVCTCRFDKERTLDLKPAKGREKHGNKVRVGYKYHWQPVKEMYEKVARTPVDDVDLKEDDSTSTQVAKLLVGREYMRFRRAQLLDQKERLGEWVSLRRPA